jgi:hypothetical protein
MTKKEAEAEEKRKLAVLAKAGEQAIGIKSESQFPKAVDGEFKPIKGNVQSEASKLDQNKLF